MIQSQILYAINLVANVYYVLLLVRIIFSWLNLERTHPALRSIYRITYAATEPLLRPIRNLLFRYQRRMPIDFSPLVAWLLIEFIRRLLFRAVHML